MAKRMLDCCASDFAQFTKADLLESIQKSEGRVIACETIGSVQPLLGNVTNAEFAASMGADILLLNLFDVRQPVIHGLPPVEPGETIRLLKKLTGRPVGINLEPVADDAEIETDPMWAMSAGRRATVENALRAKKLGIDFVLLTGNPGVGVTNTAIEQTLRRFKEAVGDSIVLAAGKMHAAGILSEAAENIMTEQDIASFVEAGADIILLPAPGTVPGITQEYAQRLITCAHQHGAQVGRRRPRRCIGGHLGPGVQYFIVYGDWFHSIPLVKVIFGRVPGAFSSDTKRAIPSPALLPAAAGSHPSGRSSEKLSAPARGNCIFSWFL